MENSVSVLLGFPATGVCGQGKSVAKLKRQGDPRSSVLWSLLRCTLVKPTFHLCGAGSSAAFGPSMEAPEPLMELGSPGLMAQSPQGTAL